jgi:hypothetical protein
VTWLGDQDPLKIVRGMRDILENEDNDVPYGNRGYNGGVRIRNYFADWRGRTMAARLAGLWVKVS